MTHRASRSWPRSLSSALLPLAALATLACTAPPDAASPEPGSDPASPAKAPLSPAGMQLQGMQLQGMQLQGMQLQGAQLGIVSVPYAGFTLNGLPLSDVNVQRGGVVARLARNPIRDFPGTGRCPSEQFGAARDCAWTSVGWGTCVPGMKVTAGAAAGCNLGSSSGDQMLRVCNGYQSTCTWGSPGLLASDDDSVCGGVNPEVTFLCPASGYFNVMAGAYDSAEPVQVSLGVLGAGFQKTLLSGPDLSGAQFVGNSWDFTNNMPGPQYSMRVSAITVEGPVNGYTAPALPPAAQGWTWDYQVQVYLNNQWIDACTPDFDGRDVAIPLAATWNQYGDRVEDAANFTFGCTSAVLAKAYRWGYRPWWNAIPGDPTLMRRVHQAATRMARADYCGDGVPHTMNATLIDEWDTLAPPVQLDVANPGLLFEAGWATFGAMCLSHWRWATLPGEMNQVCPQPGRHGPYSSFVGLLAPLVCDTPDQAIQEAQAFQVEMHLLNRSCINGTDGGACP